MVCICLLIFTELGTKTTMGRFNDSWANANGGTNPLGPIFASPKAQSFLEGCSHEGVACKELIFPRFVSAAAPRGFAAALA